MAAEADTDISAPSTREVDTDEAPSERPDDGRLEHHTNGFSGAQHAASLPSSPAGTPMSPMAHSNANSGQHHSAPCSPTAMSPAVPPPHAGSGAGAPPSGATSLLPPAATSFPPSSLRAGGRLFNGGAGGAGGLGPQRRAAMRTSAPPKRDLANEQKIAKHAALLQAASLAVARIKSAGGDLTPSSPGTGAAKLDWHTTGNEHIGRQVVRCVYDGPSLAGMARATVVGWLPAAESDFEDALGRPQALWRVRFHEGSLLDGEEEELELHELLESLDDDDSHSLDVDADGPEVGLTEADDPDGAGGWVTEKRQLLNGRQYHVYRGPQGAYAESYGMAPMGVDLGDGENAALQANPSANGHPGGRRGKRRCGQCATCKAEDCNKCKFCKDKAKNGGANTLRRPCSARMACLAPPQEEPSSGLPPQYGNDVPMITGSLKAGSPQPYPSAPGYEQSYEPSYERTQISSGLIE